MAGVEFAIGAKRIAPLWRILAGIVEDDWTDVIDMDGAQVAVAGYCPDWWPSATRLLIRRVRLAPAQVSADPRSRRRRTLHPDQRTLPIAELAETDTVYGYSFITNLKVSTPEQAAAVKHWYRHRAPRSNTSKMPSSEPLCDMYLPDTRRSTWGGCGGGALLAASIAGWLHQLTATPGPHGTLAGHGVRDGQTMIATLRHRLIQVPARLIRHAGALDLRLPPGYPLLNKILARLRTLPTTSCPGHTAPTTPEPAHLRRHSGTQPISTMETTPKRSTNPSHDPLIH